MAKKKIKSAQKIYVLDTNVFISDPDCMAMFEDNVIVVPDIVIEELDGHKDAPGDKGYNVRKALRNFDHLRQEGSFKDGIQTQKGGYIKVVSNAPLNLLPNGWRDSPDNRILATALSLSNEKGRPVVIVSKDTNVRIKANILDLPAEDYKHEMVDDDYLLYNGRTESFLSADNFEKFLSNRTIPADTAFTMTEKRSKFLENEFVILRPWDGSGSVLGIVKNQSIHGLLYDESRPCGITPRNVAQRFAIEALMTPAKELPLVILKGSAGTAKTFLTLACGLEQCKNRQVYRKMTVTRANVEFDRDIGALPGDETSKVGPLLRGCMDNLELLADVKDVKKNGGKETDVQEKVQELIDRGYISTEALSFLRGRSLTRQILYVDEAQNTTISQMKGILTRVGSDTKLVISGDLNQIDNPRLNKYNNGLAYALKLMSGDPLCCVIGFTDEETTRSELAARVASLIS